MVVIRVWNFLPRNINLIDSRDASPAAIVARLLQPVSVAHATGQRIGSSDYHSCLLSAVLTPWRLKVKTILRALELYSTTSENFEGFAEEWAAVILVRGNILHT